MLCMAMYAYVGLCKAMESTVYHISTKWEPLYDAYTTYLPRAPGYLRYGEQSHLNLVNKAQ